jgi:hypothetical protein
MTRKCRLVIIKLVLPECIDQRMKCCSRISNKEDFFSSVYFINVPTLIVWFNFINIRLFGLIAPIFCIYLLKGHTPSICYNYVLFSTVINSHFSPLYLCVNCLLTALKQDEQITNRCPRQHIQRHISDRS